MKPTLVLILLSSLLLISCQSGKKTPAIKAENFRQEYLPLLKASSRHDIQYDGLQNKFEYHATLLTSGLMKMQKTLEGHYKQWSEKKVESEISKAHQEASQKTQIFLSFFSPSSDIENLTSSRSPWTFYLESDGKRYKGKARDIRRLRIELEKYYPYHNRWSQAYSLTFDVPVKAIERGPTKLVMTGPLGSSTSDFSIKK